MSEEVFTLDVDPFELLPRRTKDERRILSRQPFMVLHTTPPMDEDDIDKSKERARAYKRPFAREYHPEGTNPRPEIFDPMERAYNEIRIAVDSDLLAQSYVMMFGNDAKRWAVSEQKLVRPMVEAVVDVLAQAEYMDADVILCDDCEGTGMTMTRSPDLQFPIPVCCIVCAGEGGLYEAGARVQHMFTGSHKPSSPQEPYWNKIADTLPDVQPEDGVLTTIPTGYNSLREAISSYVLAEPHLCTRPYAVQLASTVAALGAQAIKHQNSLSTVLESYSHPDAVQRMMDDCLLGFTFLEVRKGRKHVLTLLENLDLATIAATGGSIRRKKEQEMMKMRERNTFVSRDPIPVHEAKRDVDINAYHSTEAKELIRFPEFRTYKELLAWMANLEAAGGILDRAAGVSFSKENCTKWLSFDPDLHALIQQDTVQYVGPLELAMFVRTFVRRHHIANPNPMSLPQSHFDEFAKLFQLRVGREQEGLTPIVDINEETAAEFYAHAREIFPDFPDEAERQCRQAMDDFCVVANRHVLPGLPSQFQGRETGVLHTILRGAFPCGETVKEHHLAFRHHHDFEATMRDDGLKATEALNSGGIVKQKLAGPNDIVGMGPDRLQREARAHSSPLDWNRVVRELEPRQIAEVLTDLFGMGERYAALACGICLLAISTDDFIPDHEDMAPGALFVNDSPLYAELVQTGKGAKTLQILNAVPTNMLRYLATYVGWMRDAPATLRELLHRMSDVLTDHVSSDILLWHPHWRDETPNDFMERIDGAIRMKRPIGDLMEVAQTFPIGSFRRTDHIEGRIIEAFYADGQADMGYTQALLSLVSHNEMAMTCAYVMSNIVQLDVMPTDVLESEVDADRAGLPEFREAFLDFPLYVFANLLENEDEIPKAWAEFRRFCNIMTGFQKVSYISSYGRKEKSAGQSISRFAAERDGDLQVYNIDVFNSQKMKEEHFPIIAAFARGDHPFLPCISTNVLKAGRAVQKKLLTSKCLNDVDAGRVAFDLLTVVAAARGKSVTQRDETSAFDFHRKHFGEKKHALPRKYGFLNEVFERRPFIRPLVGHYLEFFENTPLCAIENPHIVKSDGRGAKSIRNAKPNHNGV